jgi:hypothetical protein
MSERVEGKIALEEHFYLPSFETFGADGSALDGAGKAQNYLPDFFASVQKRGSATTSCGSRRWIGAVLS